MIGSCACLSPLDMFLSAAALDKNSWVYDVSGLLQHCVALLRLCHSLSEKLSKIPLQAVSFPILLISKKYQENHRKKKDKNIQSIRQHPPLNTVLCEATHRVLPAFDDLLNSVASPNVRFLPHFHLQKSFRWMFAFLKRERPPWLLFAGGYACLSC